MKTKTQDSTEVISVTLNSKRLLATLALVGKAISANTVVPLMEDVHVVVKPGVLHFTGSDYKQTVMSIVEYPNLAETGAFMLPHKKTMELLKTLPDTPVTIEHTRTGKPNQKGKIEIVCVVILTVDGKKFKLATEDHIDYPKPQIFDGEKITLPAAQLTEAIQLCLSTVGTDDLKPAYCGVYFNTANGHIVSCDGGNLTIFKTGVPLPCAPFLVNSAFARLIIEVPTGEEDITMEVSENSVRLSNESFSITSQLISDRFPDYEMVIPSKPGMACELDLGLLASSLRRSLIFVNHSFMVKFKFEPGKLSLISENLDYGDDSEQEIEIDANFDLEIGTQGKALLQILQKLTKNKARVELTAPNRAIMLYPEGTRAKELVILTMPVMLNNVV